MTNKLTPREQARRLGQKKYFSGTACPEGHVCERYVENARCVLCHRIYAREYQRKLREKLK